MKYCGKHDCHISNHPVPDVRQCVSRKLGMSEQSPVFRGKESGMAFGDMVWFSSLVPLPVWEAEKSLLRANEQASLPTSRL